MTNNSIPPAGHLFKLLRTSGGSFDMAVNGAVTPVTFRVTATNGSAEVTRINFVLTDGAIRYGQFGGLGAALTNGITVKAHDVDGSVLFDYLDDEAIKTNEQVGWLSGVDNLAQPAAGDDSFPVRWTIERSGKKTLLTEGQYIEVTIADDLRGLSSFSAMAQGENL
jgi:hypothetical protein